MVAASVAAAWAYDSENTSCVCGQVKPRSRLMTSAAPPLPAVTETMKAAASRQVDGSESTLGSTRNPTDTRNAGMNSAAPKNSMRSISGPPLGTSRLSASPAKNAPMIPSMPPSSATNDADRKATSMKTKRRTRSWPSPEKNQRPSQVSTIQHQTASTPSPTSSSSGEPWSSMIPATTASTSSASVSVITVAPTVVATAGSEARP